MFPERAQPRSPLISICDPETHSAGTNCGPEMPPNWVIWRQGDEDLVFDLTLNVPVFFSSPESSAQALRRLRDANAETYTTYPGRPCHQG